MSDTRFTASNGWYVECGMLYGSDDRPFGPIRDEWVSASIEYGAHQARAERDAVLGRWRSVEHPDWVVYPHEREDHVDLLNERNRHRLTIPRSAFYHIEEEDEAYAVKAEYWAAHPVPELKPWEDAASGELWSLMTADGDAVYLAILADDYGMEFVGLKDRFSAGYTGITAGRRIWPEVSA